jgi:hypothetical protein
LKLRGRAQQPGLHSYQITSDGFSVFPRLEGAPTFEGLRLHLTTTPLASLGDTLVVVQQYEIAGELRRLSRCCACA